MQVNTITILEAFDSNYQLQVPFFQRPYVWGEDDQWEPLWDDIIRIVNDDREDPHHFLGAIILNPPPTHSNGVPKMHIIDGQQRLLTLQIILAAMRDAANDLNLFDERGQLEEMVQNSSSFASTRQERLKIFPAIPDRHAFSELILGTPPFDSNESTLYSCYNYFKEKILGILDQIDLDYHTFDRLARKLVHMLQTGLRVVRIELGEDDDPQVIFESLNARSQPLTAADLIKNFLVAESKLDGLTLEKAHEKSDSVWRMFLASYWREKRSFGRQAHPKIDSFLFHFLSMKLERDVRMPSLYRDFKKWFYSVETPALGILEDIRKYGIVYQQFDKKSEQPKETKDGPFFYKLSELNMTTCYPLLLWIYGLDERSLSLDNRLYVLNTIESFIFRREALNRTNKNYLTLFSRMLGDIAQGSRIENEIERLLLKGQDPSTSWPHDYELQEQIPVQPVKTGIAKLILSQIVSDQEKIHIADLEKWKVEFLIPLNWTEYSDCWPIDGSTREVERRNSLLKTLGNMTLVKKKLRNEDASFAWHTRRNLIADNGDIAINYSLPAQVNEQEIEDRSREFAELIRNTWPRPNW